VKEDYKTSKNELIIIIINNSVKEYNILVKLVCLGNIKFIEMPLY